MPEKIYSTIGYNIKRFRTLKKMTQPDLAKKLEITPQQLSRYERGEDRAPARTLYQLRKIFGVGTDSFFMENNNGK